MREILQELLKDEAIPGNFDEDDTVFEEASIGHYPKLSDQRRQKIKEEIDRLTEIRAKQIEEEARIKKLEDNAAQRSAYEKQLQKERKNDPEGLTLAQRSQKGATFCELRRIDTTLLRTLFVTKLGHSIQTTLICHFFNS